jgi:hypothetical protein
MTQVPWGFASTPFGADRNGELTEGLRWMPVNARLRTWIRTAEARTQVTDRWSE